jgi:hypothetical protein
LRSGFELIVNHYARRRGIAAPWSEKYAARLRPEGGGGGHASTFDQLGFGTLTESIDPVIANPKPTGLTARKHGGSIVLSWWGVPGAASYTVKRSSSLEGRVTVIAKDVKDLLTVTDAKAPEGLAYYSVTAVFEDGKAAVSDVIRISTEPKLHTRLAFDGTGSRVVNSADGKPSAMLSKGLRRTSGVVDDAVQLDGKDDDITLKPGVMGELADFTIAAWVRIDSHQSWARLFDFGDDRGCYMFLAPCSNQRKLRFAVSTVYGYNEQVIEGPVPLPTNRWVHVAVTLSGRLGTLYVDGEAVGSNPEMDFPPFQVGNTPRNWIGRSQFENDPYLKGCVDEFRIYDGALNAAQIAALAKPPEK